MAAQRLLVDIHTHVYLPRYAAFLRSRATVPRIFTRTSPDSGRQEERLLTLDDEFRLIWSRDKLRAERICFFWLRYIVIACMLYGAHRK